MCLSTVVETNIQVEVAEELQVLPTSGWNFHKISSVLLLRFMCRRTTDTYSVLLVAFAALVQWLDYHRNFWYFICNMEVAT